MIARVTQGTLVRDFQASVARLQRELARVQAVVSSQRRLQAPSDDPVGAALATRLRGEAVRLEAVREGVDLGRAVLAAEDGALAQAHALLTRAREIAAQAASGTVSAADRQTAAVEVAELERALLALGNTAIAGRHVFGGLARGAPPFASLDDPGFDPAAAYGGPAEPFSVRAAADHLVRLTTPGDQVFGAAIVALDELRQTLAAGASPAASLDQIAAAAEDIRQERASVGGRLGRLEVRERELREALDGARVRLGRLEDADLTAAIVQLTQLQIAFEATLAAGRSLLETSVLDALRP
jgi:flagellar hook-associated protein 3 FlgL